MKPKEKDWYKNIWTLDIKSGTWVEDTENQVAFIIKTLGLHGSERILDLACGFGRHSLSLARKGYEVVGVDITKAYIDDACETAKKEGLQNVSFINADVREVDFCDEFDVVLSLADGAIGYLETDEENLKIFDLASRALRRGGRHFIDVCNADHARRVCPKRWWECGEGGMALALFEWDEESHRMLFGGKDIAFGQQLEAFDIPYGDPIRLYDIRELADIYKRRGMSITDSFSNFYGAPACDKEMQLMVVAQKQ